jgi:hypothetical protein
MIVCLIGIQGLSRWQLLRIITIYKLVLLHHNILVVPGQMLKEINYFS